MRVLVRERAYSPASRRKGYTWQVLSTIQDTMKTLTTDVNLDEEVMHLAEFIRRKWTPIANLESLFTEIRDAAVTAARSWFDWYPLWEAAVALQKERQTLLQTTYGRQVSADLYDALSTLLDSIAGESRDLSDAARSLDGKRWDFDACVRMLEVRLCDRYPELAGVRPLGWDELGKGYRDFDGQDEYDPGPDQDLFKGSNVQGVRSADFPGRIALPYVMAGERVHNRKASVALVGAVYAQFLGIKEFLNTHRLVQDLVEALPQLQVPAVLHVRNVTTENPFLKVAVECAPPVATSADFEEHLARLAAFNALTEEERASRQAERNAVVQKLLAGLTSSNPEEDKKYAAEKERKRLLLRAAFNG